MKGMKLYSLFVWVILTMIVGTTLSVQAESNLAVRMEELADKLTSSVSGEIAGIEGDLIYVGLGEKDNVFEGNRFEVVRLGELLMVGSNNRPVYKETPIAEIEITRVRKDMSFAKTTNLLMPIEKGDRVYQLQDKVKRITLTHFTYGGSQNNLTSNIYESLAVSFVQKKLQVVERSQLEKILMEQKISQSGLIDLRTAQKLGQLLGTEAVLLGTVTDMGNSIAIRARLVDAVKGLVLNAAETELPKTPEIIAMLGTGMQVVNSTTIGKTSIVSTSNYSEKGQVTQSEWFKASISQATIRDGKVNARFVIQNITSAPLLIAVNRQVKMVFADINTGFSLSEIPGSTNTNGISRTHKSYSSYKKQDAYTRVSPGQSLSIGLIFKNVPDQYKEGTVSVTVDFNVLTQDGEVKRASASPIGNAVSL